MSSPFKIKCRDHPKPGLQLSDNNEDNRSLYFHSESINYSKPLYKLPHVVYITAVGDRFYYDPYFTNEEMDTHRVLKKLRVTQLISDGDRSHTHVACFQTLCFSPIGFDHVSIKMSPEMHTWLRAPVLKLILNVLLVKCFPRSW